MVNHSILLICSTNVFKNQFQFGQERSAVHGGQDSPGGGHGHPDLRPGQGCPGHRISRQPNQARGPEPPPVQGLSYYGESQGFAYLNLSCFQARLFAK